MRWPSLAALLLVAACDRARTADVTTSAAAECNIPARLDLPTAADQPDKKPDPPTAGYAAALSWSPEFCRFRKDAPEHAGQCRDNEFGFILHGLWPQAADADGISDHPRACAIAPPVSEALVREHFCMTPSAKLIQHEWAAHGTCAWDSAEAYFAAAKRVWDGLARPDLRTPSRDPLTAGAVRTAFTSSNPGMPRDAIHVDRSNKGWLEEVLICLDRDFGYEACDDLGAPDDAPLSIWRGG